MVTITFVGTMSESDTVKSESYYMGSSNVNASYTSFGFVVDGKVAMTSYNLSGQTVSNISLTNKRLYVQVNYRQNFGFILYVTGYKF